MEYIPEKECREKLPLVSFWYDEKVIFLIAYVDTHQKSSYLRSEMLNRDFASKYFLEVFRTNPPSLINHVLPSLIFGLVIIYPWKCWNRRALQKFITNAETYLEPRQISTMELFGWTIFAKKFHHRFSIEFQIRLCNGGRYLKVAFPKIPKIYSEKTVLEYSFSKVVGLNCKFAIKLQSIEGVFSWNLQIFLERHTLKHL